MATRRTVNGILVRRFAAHLRRRRLQRGFTLAELGRLVGLSESYVALLEKCRRSPPLHVIEAFARHLKVSDPARLLAKEH
jgi:transcriptional regulator with XRE-family HTH domain